MKYLLTGDLHIKKGIFVDIALEYLEYIYRYCMENEIDNIIFLGDIFEKSSKIYNEAFVPIFHKFNEIKKNIFAFILGNHDIYSVDKENSIVGVFNSFANVYTDFYGCFPSKEYDYDFGFLPYTKLEQDLPIQKIKYLFTHLAIADFTFDNNFHVNEKIAFKRDLFSSYKMVFSGHFHKHQVKDNIVFVGSPYQLSINEMNTKKGFVILDINIDEWKFVEYKGAPEFVKITIDDIKKINKIDFKNKFVRIKISKKIDEFLKLKYILYEKGALDVVPDFESISEEISLDKNGQKIDMSMSIPDIIRDYINNIKNENVKNERLLEIFDEVVKES